MVQGGLGTGGRFPIYNGPGVAVFHPGTRWLSVVGVGGAERELGNERFLGISQVGGAWGGRGEFAKRGVIYSFEWNI